MHAVRVPPGSSAVTSTPNGALSCATDSVNPLTAYFAAWYEALPGHPTRPPIEEIWITCPLRCARMTGSTARVTFTTPNRQVSTTRRKSSDDVC